MKSHWLFTHSIILIMLLGVLNPPLYASTRKPVRCEVCCPPSGCDYGVRFQTAVNYHINLTNQQLGGQTITSGQVTDAATDLILAKIQMEQNGMMASFTNVILDYASVFEAANPDFSQYFPQMVKLGYQGTEADLMKFATTTTQAQRIALVNQVRNGGFASVMDTLIANEQTIAKYQGGDYHSPDGGPECATASQTAAWFGVLAAGAALLAAGGVAPAIGVAAVFGFVSATFTLDYVMMGC